MNELPHREKQKNQRPKSLAFSFICGETGTRTQATVARRQISNLLRYHSGTSPRSNLSIEAATKLRHSVAETINFAYLVPLKTNISKHELFTP